jgi:hypothetical protein
MATTLPHGLARPKVNRSATPNLRQIFYYIIQDTRPSWISITTRMEIFPGRVYMKLCMLLLSDNKEGLSHHHLHFYAF